MYKGISNPRQPRRFDSSDSLNDQQQIVTMSEIFSGAVYSPPPKPRRHHQHHHVAFSTTDSLIGDRDDQDPIRAFEQYQPDSRRNKFVRVYEENVDAEADEFIKLEHQKFLVSKT